MINTALSISLVAAQQTRHVFNYLISKLSEFSRLLSVGTS